MWAIVQNSKIQFGPRGWNRSAFQNWIEENMNTSFYVSINAPGSVVAIDSVTSIVPVIMDSDPTYNHYTHQLSGPFLTVGENFVEGSYKVVERDLDSVRQSLIADLANNRYIREQSGVVVEIEDKQFVVPTDRTSRGNWASMISSQLDNVNYKVDSNTWVVLTSADIQSINNTIMKKVQSDYEWERVIYTDIMASASIEKLANIDIGNPVNQETIDQGA